MYLPFGGSETPHYSVYHRALYRQAFGADFVYTEWVLGALRRLLRMSAPPEQSLDISGKNRNFSQPEYEGKLG